VAAVVGDIYHHVQLYLAARHEDGTDRASLVTRDGDSHPMHCGATTELSRALVTNYLMRPAERFRPLAEQTGLLTALSGPANDGASRGRIGVDFGSVSLCHVAAGFADATVEFAKGFAIWDLAPGHYILHAAGGTSITLNGDPLSLDHGLTGLTDIAEAMTPRQTFIAAATPQLARQILGTLNADKPCRELAPSRGDRVHCECASMEKALAAAPPGRHGEHKGKSSNVESAP
jgi:myo-inositol-1(or 4)-monophosphatase